MRIEKIKWKNFLSWGNKWHEMDFNETDSLTLICGNNGAGKSSIANLIVYMLYGKMEGFKQKEIANRYNHAFEGYLWMSNKSNQEIVIHRGLNPSLLDVTVNGAKIDIAGKSNVDDYLANEIYGITYNLFKNSIVLSVNTFKSFINLSAAEKRDIIDRIFGHTILNIAASESASELREAKAVETGIYSKLDAFGTTRAGIVRNIESVKEMIARKERESGTDFAGDIEYYEQQHKVNSDKLTLANTKITGLETRRQTLREEIAGIKPKITAIEKQLKVFEGGKCPICGTLLNDESHLKEKSDMETSLRSLKAKADEITKEGVGINATLADLADKRSKITSNINTCANKVAELRQKQQSISQEYTIKMDTLNESLRTTDEDIEKTKTSLGDASREVRMCSLVNEVFSKNGLKRYINEYYVPMVNETLEDMRSRLNIDHRIIFDNEYNCRLYFMGEEVSYSTLSSGERKKCDIAASLAFLKIIKTKMNDVNLLFLDEVLSSIDVEYCNELLTLFKEFAQELHLNMFIVHHANLENANVSKVIEVVKHNNFSNFLINGDFV